MGFKQAHQKVLTTRRIVLDAMLIALAFILGKFTIPIAKSMEISIDCLPIIVGAVILGPIDGLTIGLLAEFMTQLFGAYGLTPTTPIWMIPLGAMGFVIGLYSKHNNFILSTKQTVFITSLAAVIRTMLNTVVLYIDAYIFKYDYAVSIIIIPRLILGIITASIISILLPRLLAPIKHFFESGQ